MPVLVDHGAVTLRALVDLGVWRRWRKAVTRATSLARTLRGNPVGVIGGRIGLMTIRIGAGTRHRIIRRVAAIRGRESTKGDFSVIGCLEVPGGIQAVWHLMAFVARNSEVAIALSEVRLMCPYPSGTWHRIAIEIKRRSRLRDFASGARSVSMTRGAFVARDNHLR